MTQRFVVTDEYGMELGEIEWYHLNGTPCVAGWWAETGLCSEGHGPVTPRVTLGRGGDGGGAQRRSTPDMRGFYLSVMEGCALIVAGAWWMYTP